MRPLELIRRALGDQPPLVEHRDLVGELIRLLQVMRRQEDRDPAVDEVADDLPHGPAAARVEARGRLVEEDDPRVADQGHREVEPATRAAGVGDGRLPRLLDQVESLEQLGGPPPALALPDGAGRP